LTSATLPPCVSPPQDDWEGWTGFTKDVGKQIQIVGDDLTVTNPLRIERAAKSGACNALLLKVCTVVLQRSYLLLTYVRSDLFVTQVA
jgi:hypothetical protein